MIQCRSCQQMTYSWNLYNIATQAVVSLGLMYQIPKLMSGWQYASTPGGPKRELLTSDLNRVFVGYETALQVTVWNCSMNSHLQRLADQSLRLCIPIEGTTQTFLQGTPNWQWFLVLRPLSWFRFTDDFFAYSKNLSSYILIGFICLYKNHLEKN